MHHSGGAKRGIMTNDDARLSVRVSGRGGEIGLDGAVIASEKALI